MSAAFIARFIISGIAAGQGVMPLLIDLNRTHATNPVWPGHARFHSVYQVFTLLPAAAIQLALLWWPGPDLYARFYLAAALTATSLFGFVIATLARSMYGGTLHDPNGIQPVHARLGDREYAVDLNVAIVAAAALLLAAAVLVFRLG